MWNGKCARRLRGGASRLHTHAAKSMADDRVRAARDLLLRAVESLDDCTPTPLPSESATVRQQSSTRRGEPPPPTAPTAQEPGPSTLVRTERNRLFNFGFRRKSTRRPALNLPTKSKKKKVHTWCHDFVCLSSTTATKPPSSLETATLLTAGLGRKQLTLFEGDGSFELHTEIMQAFPRLQDGGGYELLRVSDSGQRSLQVIPSPSDGYSVSYLKEVLRQAKVYIRPMQKDLSLDSEPCDVTENVSVLPLFFIVVTFSP